jgi:phospholipase/lecithinase/hemolysin
MRCINNHHKLWKIVRALASIAVLGATLSNGVAKAGLSSLENLFVFGDSISDIGNSASINYAAIGFAYPLSPPYERRRFSNGPVAVEYLWNRFNPEGPQLQASSSGGTNFAVSGSSSGVTNSISKLDSTPFLSPIAFANAGNASQLKEFSSSHPFNPDTSLVMIWLFSNDVFWWLGTNQSVGSFDGIHPISEPILPAKVVSNAVANIQGSIETLAASGARHFLIPRVADLGKTPALNGSPSSLIASSLTRSFNSALAITLNDLILQNPELDIDIVPIDDLVAEVQATPSAFGFTDASNSCLDNLLCRDDNHVADTYFFWDGTHPTRKGHALIGEFLYQAVVRPVPGPFTAAGVPVVLAWSRRLRSRLKSGARPNSPCAPG